jgi:hypothetical protein
VRLFRDNPEAGLRKAEAALEASARRIAELRHDRAVTLRESDDVAPITVIDGKIAEELRLEEIHRDRHAALTTAIKERRAEEAEQARRKAIAKVEARVAEVVADAEAVEQAVKNLGSAWYRLLGWRSTLLRDWPEGLERPLASALNNVGPLVTELGYLLYGEGRPAAGRACSIKVVAPVAVAGLEPRGLKRRVVETCASVVAQLKSARVQPTDSTDEEAA